MKVAERREYVVAMRTAGATFRQIADQAIVKFGVENLPGSWGERYAHRDMAAVLEQMYKGMSSDLRAYAFVQVNRYESLIRSLWPKAVKNDLGHVDRVLKAMQGMNKLMGLDAPQKLDVRVEQIDTRIEQLMATIEGQPVAQLAAGREEEAPGKAGAKGFGSDDAVVEGSFRAA